MAYDPLQVYANQGYLIDFLHIASDQGISFYAFIPEGGFEDRYDSTWESEEVYGRMDPIQNFKNTKRTISLTWDVPSIDFEDAKKNQRKAERLLQMLYPTYDTFGSNTTNALHIKASPLFKVKFSNLISSIHASGKRQNKEGSLARSSGLVATLNGLSYKPHFESGFFEDKKAMALYPQTTTFSCTMVVLHNHSMGFNMDGKFAPGSGFPYAPSQANKQSAPKQEPPRPIIPTYTPLETAMGMSIPGETPEVIAESKVNVVNGRTSNRQ